MGPARRGQQGRELCLGAFGQRGLVNVVGGERPPAEVPEPLVHAGLGVGAEVPDRLYRDGRAVAGLDGPGRGREYLRGGRGRRRAAAQQRGRLTERDAPPAAVGQVVAHRDHVPAVVRDGGAGLGLEVRQKRRHMRGQRAVIQAGHVDRLESQVGRGDLLAFGAEPAVHLAAPGLGLEGAAGGAVAPPEFGVHASQDLHDRHRRNGPDFVALPDADRAEVQAPVHQPGLDPFQRQAVPLARDYGALLVRPPVGLG